ncbi:MAG: sialidase family protein [Armatimonadota bacterium]
MWMIAVLAASAAVAAEMPEPFYSFAFESETLPHAAELQGTATLVEGRSGRCLELVRAPKVEDRTRLVYSRPGRHCGFPDLILLQSGELLAHFREGPGHVGRGVIRQMRSTDGGETWSDPVTIFADPEWDSRSHCTGIELESGTILLGFYRHRTGADGGFTLARVLRSTDGGESYEVIDLPNPYTDTYVYNIGRPIQLPDGTVLMPLHGEVPETGMKATGIIRSGDDGRTWGDFSLIAHGTRDYWEANVALLPGGELLAMNRSEPGPWMWQCRSSDYGYTWTEPESSGMRGDVGELLVLDSGNIMCAYRSQEPGTADTRASISRDNGHTWTDEIVIDPNDGDRGYTSSVQLPDGRILILNYSTVDGVTGIRSRVITEDDFDGSAPSPGGGWVRIPYSADLSLREALTVAAWIRPRSQRRGQRVLWKDRALSLYLTEEMRLDGWVMVNDTAADAVSSATVALDEWTHVAMTYARDDPARQVRLFINGEEAEYATVEHTEGDGLIAAREEPLFISGSDYPFDGLIDEVRVYGVALTPEQVAALAAR